MTGVVRALALVVEAEAALKQQAAADDHLAAVLAGTQVLGLVLGVCVCVMDKQ